MRRIVAIVVVALLLVGCSQQDPFEDLSDGSCTRMLGDSVDTHISGQIDALAQKDWELAYSFASDDFRSNVAIDNFTVIVYAQYSMLIENTGYEFNDCIVTKGLITQEVSVTSGEQVFDLTYTLTVNESTLGVDSAVISSSITPIDA